MSRHIVHAGLVASALLSVVCGIALAAQPINDGIDFGLIPLLGTGEHHVLQKMGDAVVFLRFIARTDAHHQSQGHSRRSRARLYPHLQAIVQNEAGRVKEGFVGKRRGGNQADQ